MEFYEKRPRFKAVRYDGEMGCLQELQRMVQMDCWSISSDHTHESVLTFTINGEDSQWRVPLNSYLVVSPQRRDGTPIMQVLSAAQMRDRFEQVAP